MTLSQLEYIVAVDTHRHFALAAEHCFVTQPTLSMQIQKLEETLGVKIFDRTKQPILPTEIGEEIISQARIILRESKSLTEIVKSTKNSIKGELRVSIIPTLAPYLLPLFLQNFAIKYPLVKLIIKESTTDHIVLDLKKNKIDVGILVSPLNEANIKEQPLFYEKLLAYVSPFNSLYNKEYIVTQEIDPTQLWLLEEGHCFRSQILQICELKRGRIADNFEYEAGSIETLMRLVENGSGITIIPELATINMPDNRKQLVKNLHENPVREVSLATHRDYVKPKLIEALKLAILQAVPQEAKDSIKLKVVGLR